MIRLLYFSQAIPTLTGADLKEILESAQRHNKEESITGVLVYGGNVFVQILEGPVQVVFARFLRILQDKRHGDVEVLRVTPARERLFEDWSMALVEATPLEFQDINDFKARHLALGEPQDFLNVMRGLLELLKTRHQKSETQRASSSG